MKTAEVEAEVKSNSLFGAKYFNDDKKAESSFLYRRIPLLRPYILTGWYRQTRFA